MKYRILQICFRMPWPLKDGGAIAMYQMTTGLLEHGHELTLAIPLTDKHFVGIDQLPENLKSNCRIHCIKINIKTTFAGAFMNLFSKKPYYISRYKRKNFKHLLQKILTENDFDFILFESLKMSPYLPLVRKLSHVPLILRSHNTEHLIWRRLAENSTGLRKLYLKLLSNRLEKYELSILPKFDAVLTISSADYDYFFARVKPLQMINLPCGVDFKNYPYQPEKAEKNTIFHLGALDWMPNLEAVDWLLNAIWPEITRHFPDFKLYLAGRNMPDRIKKLRLQNVVIAGEVENAVDFMLSKQIMVIPLLSGSGLKIKIIEGMAMGKIIITTPVGAEGTGAVHQKNILIAGNVKEFKEAIRWITGHPEEAEKLGTEARQHALTYFDNKKLMKSLTAFLQTLHVR